MKYIGLFCVWCEEDVPTNCLKHVLNVPMYSGLLLCRAIFEELWQPLHLLHKLHLEQGVSHGTKPAQKQV